MVAAPFTPAAADVLRASLPGAKGLDLVLDGGLVDAVRSAVSSGDPFTTPGLMFAKLPPEDLVAWAHRFAGEEVHGDD